MLILRDVANWAKKNVLGNRGRQVLDGILVVVNGKLGIGTTSPRNLLDVVSSLTTGDNVSSYFGSAYSLTLQGRQDNNADAGIWQNVYLLYNSSGAATHKSVTTHASFGQRGISFSYGAGIRFYADNAATTAGGTVSPTERMRITNAGLLILTTSHTPASAAATGTAGTIAWDANYLYVCVATNTWKRAAIATW